MKNTLLTTTALALTSFAGTASAVEIAAGAVNLDIGGFFRTTAAISNVDLGANMANKDYDGLDILTNSEIHFKPSITLDNGIKIGADIELEGNTADDQIDESTIFATGGFGKIELGSKDSAGKLMQVYAPDVSLVYANSSSLSSFVPFTGPTTVPDFAGDADRLTYFTPVFGGFQVAVSYARNDSQTNGPVDNNADGAGTDYFDIGATYKGTVGDVALGLSARYGTYERGAKARVFGKDAVAAVDEVLDNDGNVTTNGVKEVAAVDPVAAVAAGNPTVAGVGLSLGFGDFSIGGGYVERDMDIAGESNEKTYDIGVSFANGPMGYSLTYVKGETAGNKAELTSFVAAATYTVNPNFVVSASLASYEKDVSGTTTDDIDGQVLALSAQFNF